MNARGSHGLWNALSAVEMADSLKIAKMLNPFSRPITDCYECGVEAPTLDSDYENTDDIRIAGLFLKRLLNDLRATWNLLLLGYTSQAGTVAAAAFESALIVACVAGDPSAAIMFVNSKSRRVPWSVADLCRKHARLLEEQSTEGNRVPTANQEWALWEALYAQYMWLCKVKHPTIPSALHDAFSVSLTGEEYIIMGAPDSRQEDLPSKAFILSVVILKATEAVRCFALARRLDRSKSNFLAWQKRLDSIEANLDKAVDPIMNMPLPFDYAGRIPRMDHRHED